MRFEATLTTFAALVVLWFVSTRNAFAMGALVFVATPLLLVSIGFYVKRVFSELNDKHLL